MENSSETSLASTDSETNNARNGSPDPITLFPSRSSEATKSKGTIATQKRGPAPRAPRTKRIVDIKPSDDERESESDHYGHDNHKGRNEDITVKVCATGPRYVDVARPIKSATPSPTASTSRSWADQIDDAEHAPVPPPITRSANRDPGMVVRITNAMDTLRKAKGKSDANAEEINTAINALQELRDKALEQQKAETEAKRELRRLRMEVNELKEASRSGMEASRNGIDAKELKETIATEIKASIINEIKASFISELRETVAGELRELRDTIAKTAAEANTAVAPRTWAQTVAAPSPSDVEAARLRQTQLQAARELRQKTEVIINVSAATDTADKVITNARDLTKTIQNEINGPLRRSGKQAKITTAARTSRHLLKLTCPTPEDAEVVKALNWHNILEGTKVHKPTYGIVVHGVDKMELNLEDQDRVNESIEASNKEVENLKVVRTAPLMRKARNEDAPTQSVVLFVEDINSAIELTEKGVKVGHRLYRAEKYSPQMQLKRCFKCQGFGHKAMGCTRPTKCSKCGEGHDAHECTSTNLKCANCGDANHRVWHKECPRQQKELERLRLVKASISTVFTKPSLVL
jgi:hypothetical protein